MVNGFDFIGEAKWRELKFIYVSSSTSGGRKTVLKKVINSDLQIVEDLGFGQRLREVNGLIAPLSEDQSGDPLESLNYISKRNAFIKALEIEGIGTLVHPIDGPIPNLVVTGYNLEETVTELGIGKIKITFEVSNVIPVLPSTVEISSISAQSDIVLDVSKLSIEDNVIIDTNVIGIYEGSKDKTQEISDQFNSSLNFADKLEDSIDSINVAISDFQADVIALASQPLELAASIDNIFRTIKSAMSSAIAMFDVYKNIFGFGYELDPNLNVNTTGNTQRSLNNCTLNNAMNASALAGAFLAVSQKDQKTVSEIDADIQILEDQLVLMINSTCIIDPNVLDSILDLREITYEFLEERKLNVSKIISVDTKITSARALSYLYYGDDSESVAIAELNSGSGLVYDNDVEIFST